MSDPTPYRLTTRRTLRVTHTDVRALLSRATGIAIPESAAVGLFDASGVVTLRWEEPVETLPPHTRGEPQHSPFPDEIIEEDAEWGDA